MNNQNNGDILKPFRYLAFSLICQGVIALSPSLTIPGDPKNSFFLGFSIFRWLEIFSFLVVIFFLMCISLNVKNIAQFLINKIGKTNNSKTNYWFGFFLTVIFWITVWFPPSGLPKLQDEIIRIKPLLLFLELLFIEFYGFFNWNSIKTILNRILGIFLHAKNLIFVIPFVLIILLFSILKIFFSKSIGIVSFLTPGPPIFPFQMLISLIFFVSLFFVEFKNPRINDLKKNQWDILLFFLIWGGVFLLWTFTPFKCSGDRSGPFPPFNICYPQVDDSVLSIGAHYITLGRGILNHWFTDKPLYMLFLAIGQWIFGQRIDQYIVFQIIVISSIPALLFSLIRNWVSKSGSILLAMFSAILGMNSIYLYSKLDGANVQIENTELLTGFLLVLLAISLIQHFTKKEDNFYAFISGCLLALATLTRINPVFILPFIIGAFFIQNRLILRKGLTNTLICLLGFVLVFSPWLITAKDSSGNNFYLSKIEWVLNARYPSLISTNNETMKVTEEPDNLIITATKNPEPSLSDKINTDLPNNESKIGNIFYYFLNNEIQSLAKLPINLTLSSMPVVFSQPFWTKSADAPIWALDFSVENIVVFCLNLIIIILGINFAFKSSGISGIIPLFIQIGYYFGNGVAQTSGDRYLQPVEWVILLYFVIGIFGIANFLISGHIKLKSPPDKIDIISKSQKFGLNKSIFRKIGLTTILIMVGLSLYLTNYIKDTVVTLDSKELSAYVQQVISYNSDKSDFELNTFLKNSKSLIAEGVAYHSRYYASPIFTEQPKVFETTVLGENYVYISNWVYEPEFTKIPDGSRVILVGCKMKEINYWGVKSVIVKTLALIQVDRDNNLLLAKSNNFMCQ